MRQGDGEDERERSINQRAMAAVGTVLMVALTAVIAALAGASYVAALLVLHRRS